MTRTRGQPRLIEGEETKPLTVKLPVSIKRAVQARAILAAVPVSRIVREALDEYLRARSG